MSFGKYFFFVFLRFRSFFSHYFFILKCGSRRWIRAEKKLETSKRGKKSVDSVYCFTLSSSTLMRFYCQKKKFSFLRCNFFSCHQCTYVSCFIQPWNNADTSNNAEERSEKHFLFAHARAFFFMQNQLKTTKWWCKKLQTAWKRWKSCQYSCRAFLLESRKFVINSTRWCAPLSIIHTAQQHQRWRTLNRIIDSKVWLVKIDKLSLVQLGRSPFTLRFHV